MELAAFAPPVVEPVGAGVDPVPRVVVVCPPDCAVSVQTGMLYEAGLIE